MSCRSSPWNWFIATGIYLDDVEREISSIIWHGVGFLAVIALISAVLIYILSRGVTVPLRQLTTVIKRLTMRDYEVAVAWQERQDEVGGHCARNRDLQKNPAATTAAAGRNSRQRREGAA